MTKLILAMIPVSEQLPEDKQRVLIDNGASIEPSQYNARLGTFDRYNNSNRGDRSINYFYSGVVSWCPFPEPSSTPGFKAEQEPPPNYKEWLESVGKVQEVTGESVSWAEPCDNPAADVVKDQGCKEKPGWTDYPPAFPNGEPRGEDGWPTSDSFSSIGL